MPLIPPEKKVAKGRKSKAAAALTHTEAVKPVKGLSKKKTAKLARKEQLAEHRAAKQTPTPEAMAECPSETCTAITGARSTFPTSRE